MSEDLNNFESDLERGLGSLSPRPVQAGRDRLMFEAGRRRERRTLRLWQSAAGGLAALLAVSVFMRPEPREAVRVVTVTQERPPVTMPAFDNAALAELADLPQPAYLRMRDAVLNRGLDALAADRSGGVAPREAPTMLDLQKHFEESSSRNGGRL